MQAAPGMQTTGNVSGHASPLRPGRSVGHAWESRRGRVSCGVRLFKMAPRKAANGIETKEVLSAVVLADSFTQVRRDQPD